VRYRKLGPLQVSVVGLGCINFGRRVDQSGTNRVVGAALAAGVTFFDTADRYGGAGTGESMLGVALRGRRDEVVVATKFGMSMGDGVLRRGSREYIRHSIEGSLRRLETDHIDQYQHHEEDPGSPLDETIAALEELVQEGKVRAYGTSNYRPESLARARAIGGTAYVSEQSEYSWLDRRAETQLLPCCRQLGLAFIPNAPLYSGLLSGAVGRDRLPAAGTRLDGETIPEGAIDVVETLTAWAASRGRSLLEVAIGGLAAVDPVVSVIAGATTPEQVRANVAAGSWEPTELEVSELQALTP
jgi:aryl-alcohol dehydrogenase-like predicted oxidoreductase